MRNELLLRVAPAARLASVCVTERRRSCCRTPASPLTLTRALHCPALASRAGIYPLSALPDLPPETMVPMDEVRTDLNALQALLLLFREGDITQARRRQALSCPRPRGRRCRRQAAAARRAALAPSAARPAPALLCCPLHSRSLLLSAPRPSFLQEQVGKYSCGWLLSELRRLLQLSSPGSEVRRF